MNMRSKMKRWFSFGNKCEAQSADTGVLEKLKNNEWFKYDARSDTAIVFVHGLLADSERCWLASNKAFWPQLVANDAAFTDVSIFLGGYHTRINSGRYDIAQCASELFDAIDTRHLEKRSPLEFDNLVFICHSLGGIVTRRLIESNVVRFQDKSLGLVLMASPARGSEYANRFKALAKIYNHKIAAELLPESDALLDLDNRFHRLLDERLIKIIVGAEATEMHGPIAVSYLPALSSLVVDDRSVGRYFGVTKIIPDTDHFSIVKPTSITHPSAQFFAHFYAKKFQPVKQHSRRTIDPVLPVVEVIALSASVLFEVYNKSCRKFYLPRAIDNEFEKIAELFSVWVWWPSGSGKTALVRRFLDLKCQFPIEVTLAHSDGEATRDYCIHEVLDTARQRLSRDGDSPRSTFNDLVSLISAHADQYSVALFLDEVPIGARSGIDAVPATKFIADLLDAVKTRAGPKVRFVVSSIRKPKVDFIAEKFREQLTFVELKNWSDLELRSLVQLIEKAMPDALVDTPFLERLIARAAGSPRFLKTFYRNFHVSGYGAQTTPEAALSRTSDMLGCPV